MLTEEKAVDCLKELEFLKKILDKCHIENKIMKMGELVYDKLGTVYSQIMNKRIMGKTFSDFFPEVKATLSTEAPTNFCLNIL